MGICRQVLHQPAPARTGRMKVFSPGLALVFVTVVGLGHSRFVQKRQTSDGYGAPPGTRHLQRQQHWRWSPSQLQRATFQTFLQTFRWWRWKIQLWIAKTPKT